MITPRLFTIPTIFLIVAGSLPAYGTTPREDAFVFPDDTQFSMRFNYHRHNPESKIKETTKGSSVPSIHMDYEEIFNRKSSDTSEDAEEDQIPLDLLKEIENIQNPRELQNYIENYPNTIEFADKFGEEKKQISTNYSLGICIPQMKLFSFEDEMVVPKGQLMVPKCVRIEQCGGCCNDNKNNELIRSCEPVEVETVRVTITLLSYNKKVNKSKRKRDFNCEASKTIELERHLKCACQCKIQEEDCNDLQIYNKNECKCVCNNNDELEKCKESSSIKIWDTKNCECVCRDEKFCSSGYSWNKQTCQCVRNKRRSTFMKRRSISLRSRNIL